MATLWPHTKTLSSSQVLTYLKDPAEFYRCYYYGVKQESQAMQIGRIFSAAYADRKLDFYAHLIAAGVGQKFINLFGQALVKFPVIKGSLPEFPMTAKLGKWTIRATLDDFHFKQSLIIENKTGKVAWTQQRADASPQVTIQCWAFWKRHARLPKRVILNWWNTRITSYPHVETFITKRSVTEVKDCEALLMSVIENIEAGNFSNPII